MEFTHRTHNIRVAPRKLRLVADQIKHMPASRALGVLPLTNRAAAHHVQKSLAAAVQVAKDNNYDADTLVIQRIFCDEGPAMRRMQSHAKGRMTSFSKQFSHLSIVLKGEQAAKKARIKATPAKTEENQPEEEK